MSLPKGRLKPVRVVRDKTTPSEATIAPPALRGPQGLPGAPGVGLRGPQGLPGAVPEHRWIGDEIQFQNPDGTWGKPRNLRGPSGGGAGLPSFKYTPIETATYTISHRQLTAGINVFGSRFDGAVTITLPEGLGPHFKDKTIIINDETGNAGANIITVQVP